jgi:hypothetical protein|tara:strand:- start:870 stop:1043 length:174 start_codon:yes stop_codon:yes gene_type:complete
MIDLKDLKKEHKRLEAVTRKTIKKRLNERTSNSWRDLRELKKLKLKIKDQISSLKKN